MSDPRYDGIADKRSIEVYEAGIKARELVIKRLGRAPVDVMLALQQAVCDVIGLYVPADKHMAAADDCDKVLRKMVRELKPMASHDCVFCGKRFRRGDPIQEVESSGGLSRMAHVVCFERLPSEARD